MIIKQKEYFSKKVMYYAYIRKACSLKKTQVDLMI